MKSVDELLEADAAPELEAVSIQDDRRYIHIRRSHFYAALLPLGEHELSGRA